MVIPPDEIKQRRSTEAEEDHQAHDEASAGAGSTRLPITGFQQVVM